MSKIPRTDSERLYDALDRLAFDAWEVEPPEHRWSPLGQAIWLLHELEQHKTERCVMTTEAAKPLA